MAPNIWIGLPAYNEGVVLPELLGSIGALRKELGDALRVLVVNDGSTDRTGAILKDFAAGRPYVKVLTHPRNLGFGPAMQTLLREAVRSCRDGDCLVTLDADNTHHPELVPILAEKLRREKLDVVVASRYAKGGKEIGLSLKRRVCSRGAAMYFRMFFPIPEIRDYSSGYRCYNIEALKRLAERYGEEIISSQGFECNAEIMARFSRMGVKAGEVPLVLHYERKKGESKMNVTRTVYGYFKLLGKVR